MDILPSGGIFRELQDIQDFGYFSSQASIEDQCLQVSNFYHTKKCKSQRYNRFQVDIFIKSKSSACN